MAEHPWVKEEVDGGPLGLGKFWHCPVCGVSGGPAEEWVVSTRKRLGKPERWDPFVPGHGVRVSEDCEEAQKQIRAHAEEIIKHLKEKWKNPRGEHSHFHSLFHDALRWNPQIKNVNGVLDLMREVEYPSALSDNKRPSLIDCRFKLEEMGFDMSGGALGAAILEMGNERLRQLRAGKDPDEEP